MPAESMHPGKGPGEITQLLEQWASGNRSAFEALVPLVYDELRRLARGYLRRERPGHTLQATALVHEAWFRLAAQQRVAWRDRTHFLAIAAQAMRRILVDHARRLSAERRELPGARVPIELAPDLAADDGGQLLAVNEALDRLAELSPRQARIIELRFFAGSTVAETAEALGVSVPTVVREWRFGRAWLRRELEHGAP